MSMNNLFTDSKAFDSDFEPELLLHRDDYVDALVRNLVDALNGHQPVNMLLHGAPGSGKTVTTKFVLSQLQMKGAEMGITVHIHEIDCREQSSRDQVNSIISVMQRAEKNIHIFMLDNVDELVAVSEKLPAKYHNKDGSLDMRYAICKEYAANEEYGLLYNLTNSNRSVSIISISNDLHRFEQLHPDITSEQHTRTYGRRNWKLFFQPYKACEMQDILNDRIRIGLSDKAIDKDIIELCTNVVYQMDRNISSALNLLRMSVGRAERKTHIKVESSDIMACAQDWYGGVPERAAGRRIHDEIAWERMDEVRTRYPHLWSEEAVRLREEAFRLQFETHGKRP